MVTMTTNHYEVVMGQGTSTMAQCVELSDIILNPSVDAKAVDDTFKGLQLRIWQMFIAIIFAFITQNSPFVVYLSRLINTKSTESSDISTFQMFLSFTLFSALVTLLNVFRGVCCHCATVINIVFGQWSSERLWPSVRALVQTHLHVPPVLACDWHALGSSRCAEQSWLDSYRWLEFNYPPDRQHTSFLL